MAGINLTAEAQSAQRILYSKRRKRMDDQRKTIEPVSEINQITKEVIGAAIEVHRTIGPGLLESAYEECLCHELSLRSLPFKRQLPLPVVYKGLNLNCSYRLDLVVADRVIIEIKAVERLLPIHEAQLMTYLKLSGLKAGLLINFNEILLKNGIKRRVSGDLSLS
jgi:GxxExxY protein